MVKPLCKDTNFLSKKSLPAGKGDAYVGEDLLDTLSFHKGRCVGMAANMIGVNKRIIAIDMGFANVLMFNPRILSKKKEYLTKEGCLSLEGERPCRRYQEIEVEYMDASFAKKKGRYSGFIAEIIEHEVDHLDGIII